MPDNVFRNIRGIIKNIGDVVAAVHACDTEFSAGAVWWRGQPKEGLPLVPKFFRIPVDSRADEQTINNNFRFKARTRHPVCSADDDYPGWLFLMQHYGLGTRLLDWSESPLVAAFFAVCLGPSDSEAEIIALSPDALNEVGVGARVIANPKTDDWGLFRSAFIRVEPAQVANVAVACDHFDARMVAQQSVFTIHGSDSPLDQDDKRETFQRSFVIPGEYRKILAAEIMMLGLSESSLFPDLEHLSRDINLFFGHRSWHDGYRDRDTHR